MKGNFLKLWISKCLCLHTPYVLNIGQKREFDLLELELKAVVNCQMWVLGTELESFDEW